MWQRKARTKTFYRELLEARGRLKFNWRGQSDVETQGTGARKAGDGTGGLRIRLCQSVVPLPPTSLMRPTRT